MNIMINRVTETYRPWTCIGLLHETKEWLMNTRAVKSLQEKRSKKAAEREAYRRKWQANDQQFYKVVKEQYKIQKAGKNQKMVLEPVQWIDENWNVIEIDGVEVHAQTKKYDSELKSQADQEEIQVWNRVKSYKMVNNQNIVRLLNHSNGPTERTTRSKEVEEKLKDLANEVCLSTDFKQIVSLLNNCWADIEPQFIIAYYLSKTLDKYPDLDEDVKREILKHAEKVKELLNEYLYYDICFKEKEQNNFSKEDLNKFIFIVNQCIKQASDIWINKADFDSLKNEIYPLASGITDIQVLLANNNSWIDYITQKMDSFLWNDAISDSKKIWVAMLYASIIQPPIDISNEDDLNIFIKTVKGEQTKYSVAFNNFKKGREERDYERRYNYAVNSLIERYERSQANAENRKFYGNDYINISNTNDNPQDQSWVQLASRIDNLDKKLSHYKFKKSKSDINDHEKSALMYTAFETTFNNTFNLNDVIIQKLVDLKIDLRSELTNYWIYDKEKNSFDKNARNKFVKDRLPTPPLTEDEINVLWKTMEELPGEVEKNYEILCGNFDADQDGFEKISKIYALGEIIDNIRTLFSDLNSKKLWNFMNLQLDEKSPADIIGDCLFIKWKINWAETNIKYDLRTWKVYMNSFTEQILNPPKIIIWNTTPNKEIWDFGSFDDAISNMNSAFMIQNNENNDSWNFNNLWDTPNDDNDSSENKQDPEDLIKNKLNRDLKSIWKIVNDEVWKQTLENDIINGFLKTFGISSNTWGSKEFVGSSKLYTILNNFINIDSEFELTEISNYMKKILKLLSFSRWEDNQTLSENKLKQNDRSNSYDIESFTIFDIDEKHATEEIKSLQIQTRKFFPNWNGNWWEKNKIGELAHFDEDVNISIINVIVDKCCIDGKLSKKSLENYFDHIHKEIIKNLSESDKATADSWLKEQLEFV